jgi:S1 RNA binding domain protein
LRHRAFERTTEVDPFPLESLTLKSRRWDSGAPAPDGEATGLPAGPVRNQRGVIDIADLEVGSVVEGTVQRITPYGAFLQLEGGRVGLVHISEIDRNYVKDVRDHLRESDVVQAKVLTIKEDGKIDLSIKALQDPQPRIDRRRGSNPEFEQKLKRFLRQSDERQGEFRRALDHKRK